MNSRKIARVEWKEPHRNATARSGRRATGVVIAASPGSVCFAASKFVAALNTGSLAVLSEGIHSVVDTGLLARRSGKATLES